MNNNIGPVSFKARLKINKTCLKRSSYAKYAERLENIKQIFAEETKQYPFSKHTLTLSKSVSNEGAGATKVQICKVIYDINCKSDLTYITDPLDKYLETMTDTKIAKKFAQIFKVMYGKHTLLYDSHGMDPVLEWSEDILNKGKADTQKTKQEKLLLNKLEKAIQKYKKQFILTDRAIKDSLKKLTRNDEKLKEFVSDVM